VLFKRGGGTQHGWDSYLTDPREQGALKAAFMAYRARQRGESAEFSAEELSSCMQNQSPGTPDLVALSFNKGFHGRLFGTLSLTRSKAIHKVINSLE
jgi:4-aminobutyrate aminotransferase/(S)-3-amino-2-methylpropionate transaminase